MILEIDTLQGALVKRRLADYVALTKPGVVVMVLITTLVGYHLGADGALDPLRILDTLVGTALAAGGTLALNQYLERDLDGLMARTRLRPLPGGRLKPVEALAFGGGILLLGLGWLLLRVGEVIGFWPTMALVIGSAMLGAWLVKREGLRVIREGLKAYSNWPTFPQLYVNGELIGGCDITVELYQSGELQKILSDTPAPAAAQ